MSRSLWFSHPLIFARCATAGCQLWLLVALPMAPEAHKLAAAWGSLAPVDIPKWKQAGRDEWLLL